MNTESDLCSILEPFPPSNKCAQIAKEWLDKGLAKCHEIAVLYPSSRNPLAWIGKIHGTSFVDTSGRAEESSRVQTREPSATAAKPPSPLRYGWLPAYTFDFPAAYALSRGCSYFILLTSSFAPPCCSLCDNLRFRIP